MKKETIVTTISNEELPKSECRKIRGIYYKIGDLKVENSGDCYKINDKFYKAKTGYIVYDHRINEYVIKKMNVIVEDGVIGIVDNEPILGSFSMTPGDPVNCVLDYKGTKYSCISDEIFEDQNTFLEDLRTGEFVHRNSINANFFVEPVVVSNGIKANLPYDSTGRTQMHSAVYDKFYKPNYSAAVEEYGPSLRDLTFGIEFETTKGFIPQRITDRLGLMSLRDGSVPGLEYVTVPLQGLKGMQTVLDSLKQLRKRTAYDHSCSMHIHIGNLPRTESFMVALMRILYMVQDEMFDMFPIYKRNNYGVKRKPYTKAFSYQDTVFNFDRVITKENVSANFGKLYNFLSMGEPYANRGNNIDEVKSHPSDPRGNGKWNIKTRYYWVNLIPLLFGNKQTVEFRIHTPTYDDSKVMNFLLLCTSIINYVKDRETAILKDPDSLRGLTLYSIVCDANRKTDKNGRLAEELHNYTRRRRDSMYSQTKDGNIIGDEDAFNYMSHIGWGKNKPVKKSIPLKYKSRRIGGNFIDEARIQNAAQDRINQLLNGMDQQEAPQPGVGIREQIDNAPVFFNNPVLDIPDKPQPIRVVPAGMAHINFDDEEGEDEDVPDMNWD